MAKLLVIDDDRAYREYLDRVLTRAGHSVTTAANGARIVQIAKEASFDAVLTDLYMPECDGIETIARLRAVLPHLPIIGMTGNAGAVDDPCSRAMRLFGAVAVLEKPLDRQRLLATIEGAIAAAAAARAGRPARPRDRRSCRVA
ncbi:MAG TPA: response regulator [Stellaceae bacterium]|nr:response regulator [Stellaceae bacterium]